MLNVAHENPSKWQSLTHSPGRHVAPDTMSCDQTQCHVRVNGDQQVVVALANEA